MTLATHVEDTKNTADSALSQLQRPEDRLVTVSWAANFLSMSHVSIRRYLTQKKLRRYKVGGKTLIRLGDLLALVKEVK